MIGDTDYEQRDGDADGFGNGGGYRDLGALFRATAGDLHAVALARTGDRSMADDLVQETFQAASVAWTSLANWTLDHQRAWLFKVLKRRVFDSYHRKASSKELATEPVDLELLDEFIDPLEDVVDQHFEDEVIDACWAAIRLMPTKRQQVLTLWARGVDDAQIAAILTIERSTVRDHRRAGLEQLNSVVGTKYRIIDDRADRRSKGGRQS